MVGNYRQLWTDVTNANGEAKAVQILIEILTDKEGRSFISTLDEEGAKLCIEVLDCGIAKHNLGVAEKEQFFTALRRLAGTHGLLPESLIIEERIETEHNILASGGSVDVRCGRYRGHRVAVRALRVTLQDDLCKTRMRFCEEVILWGALLHPNILQLVGVQGNMREGQFITISEWMGHGNIMEYIKRNHVNRLELLCGATQGLEYLHRAHLIHGALKGANILVSNDIPPRACLADYGFMKMVLDPDNPMSCSAHLDGGTLMFMSPELLAPQKFGVKNSSPSPQSDVYAFGLVIFQVLTGEIPFRGFGPTGYIFSIVEGLRPSKPHNALAIGFSDTLWSFTQRCWDANMKLRPEIAEVVTSLSRAAANWNGVMAPHIKVDHVATDSEESISDSMKHWGVFKQLMDDTPKDQAVHSDTSAPFIHVPWSPVSGRARDFIEEFNRVAADPDIGASFEQLENGAREFATILAESFLEEDLVTRLISDNQVLWNKLLQNDFCQKYMKEQPSTDKNTLETFKGYMTQDLFYIVKLCQYEVERGLNATDGTDFRTSMDKVAKRAVCAKELLEMCTTPLPNGLGIKDSDVLVTRPTEAMIQYIDLLINTMNTQNWVMSLVAMVPCVQSYYLIAVDLDNNSVHKDTPWYKLWVEENVKYKDSTEKQRVFFIQNVKEWKDHYDVANKVFQNACQAEIDLWGIAQ